jgi:hypothetical protein
MKTGFFTRLVVLMAGIGLMLNVSGCIGYKLGSNLPPGIRSIAIPVFINRTGQPALETLTTGAAIAEFQKDGSLKVAPHEQADSILEVTLTHYALTPLRYRENRTTTAQEYRLTIRANVVLRRIATKEILSQTSDVEGYTDFESLTDLPSAQRNALPKASQDLAHRIVKTVVEFW